MKTIKFILIALLCCNVIHPTNPFTMAKQCGDWIFRNTLGYIDISELYHPHTSAYLKNLREKYPHEFKETSIYILPNIGPAATFQSIYFPIYWVEKIEQEHQLNKKDGLFTQGTEWMALHEAGHVKNNDAPNGILALTITKYVLNKSDYYNPCQRTHEKIEQLKKFILNSPRTIKQLIGLFIASKAYWSLREYRADDYATQHCSNPQSIAAAYEILARQAPSGIVPGINHSFKDFRLRRIAQAYQEKFKQPMPKTYHETDRVTA